VKDTPFYCLIGLIVKKIKHSYGIYRKTKLKQQALKDE